MRSPLWLDSCNPCRNELVGVPTTKATFIVAEQLHFYLDIKTMCGIAGFALTNSVDSPLGLLKGMADVIKHRGPDDEGFFFTTNDSERWTIGLAHRRLSIIDLSGGHQPMANPANTTQIVFNGEIYNYRELRRELENKGHTFSSSSDTESILIAYDEYGTECVKKLQGIWRATKGMAFIL